MYEADFFGLREGGHVNGAISKLPIAIEKQIYDENGEEIKQWKRIEVGNDIIDIPTREYVLKQHSEAFRPIIEGITVSGIKDFQFSMWSTNKKANMSVFVGELEDGVKFGFKVSNSFNRSSSINFGFKAYQKNKSVEIVEKEHVLVWGHRQVCSNGMVIKVPLKTTKYLDAVEVIKIKELLSQRSSIAHRGKEVDSKLENMQYLVEAFLLLKNPLNKMIIDAKKFHLSKDRAEELIKLYVGKRRKDKYMALYGQEEQTLWGLYNSITFLASHQEKGMTGRVREKLLLKAGDMLEKELIVPS